MKRKRQEQSQAADEAAAGQSSAVVAEAEGGQQAADSGSEQGRIPFPKRRPWEHDNVAGVERSSYSDKEARIYETWLQFRDGKPSQEVRDFMKEQGFRWQPEVPEGGTFNANGAWVRSHSYDTLSQDRLVGERTFRTVVDMILKEKGLAPEPELQQF